RRFGLRRGCPNFLWRVFNNASVEKFYPWIQAALFAFDFAFGFLQRCRDQGHILVLPGVNLPPQQGVKYEQILDRSEYVLQISNASHEANHISAMNSEKD